MKSSSERVLTSELLRAGGELQVPMVVMRGAELPARNPGSQRSKQSQVSGLPSKTLKENDYYYH